MYKDVIINHKEIRNWENEFTPRFIKNKIVLSPSHYFTYKSYMHNLNKKNLKNDISTVISDYNKLQSSFFSGCIFSNINGTCYHHVLILISVINNLTNNNGKKTKLLIVYCTNSHLIYLNN